MTRTNLMPVLACGLLTASLAGQNIPKRPPLKWRGHQPGRRVLPVRPNTYYVLGQVDEFAGKAADTRSGITLPTSGHTRAQDPRIADVQRRLAGLKGAAPNQ